jgi:hypothetical protein
MLEAIRTPDFMRANEHRAPGRRACRALASSMVALGLVAACGPREPPLVSPGTSTANAVGSGARPSARDAAVKWEGFADLGAYRAVGKPFVSRGHFAGRWQAEVLTNQDASAMYAGLSRSSRFSEGAVLVKKHSEKDSHAPGPIFVMTKRAPGFFPQGGDWEYLVADADGWVEDRGPLPTCGRCHAEAGADWVFGLPAEARASRP